MPRHNRCSEIWLAVAVASLAATVAVVEGEEVACPEDANLWACVAWCEVAAPGSSGSMGGQACAHLREGEAGPSCMCYDSNYERVLKECRSKCPAKEKEVAEEESEVCLAGNGKCLSPENTEGATLRYLLYDVKMGEGFNLQREIFPRAGWLVWKLNKKVRKRCGGSFGSGRCAEWALVLPPWCRVAHWRESTGQPKAWREFFDSTALRSPNITVLEFDEYSSTVGGSLIDLAITHTEERVPKEERYGHKGGFYGWAKERAACKNLIDHTWVEEQQRWALAYAGNCDGGMQAQEYRCGVLSSPAGRDFVDMLLSAGRVATSVLIKKADGVSPPERKDLDKVGLREAMLFSEPIRQAGEDFMAGMLQGQRYLAAHCRRTDFLRVRTATTPDPQAIARQIDEVLSAQGLDKVFVATDAPDDLKGMLKATVKRGTLFFLHDMPEVAGRFAHSGQQAAVEMWIAARADVFMGTQDSRFTSHIQLERSWLSKPRESSQREFCRDWPATAQPATKPCLAPGYRHSDRRGSQHHAYWEA